MLAGNVPALLGAGAAPGNDNYTKLLLHFDGTNGSTVMPDSSPAQHGNAAIGGTARLATPGILGGTACLSILGGAGNIAFPYSPDWEFGAGDFTIDYWDYRVDTTARPNVVRDTTATTYQAYLIGWDIGGGNVGVYGSGDNASWNVINGLSLGPYNVNAWTHRALVRKGNTFYGFCNGVLQGMQTSSLAFAPSSGMFSIGYWGYSSTFFYAGYMDELRVSKGIARWTSNFTPPKRPYGPDYVGDTLTKLLMHFDSATTVTDSSPSKRGAATVTGSGIGTTGAQIKFGDGSCVFPGTANTYLSYPDSPDWNLAGDKTIECFVRLNALPPASNAFGFVSQVDAPSGNGWSLFVNEGGYPYLQCEVGGTYYFPIGPSGPMALNTWYHIAAVYKGGSVTVYRDGVGGTPVAVPPIPDMAQPLIIGAYGGSPPPYYWMNGYIDELRISNFARWTGNFSPPSSPYNPVTTSGPATHFVVTAPASVSLNTNFNVTVQALDALNNPTNIYSGTVHLTSSTGAVVLPADSALSSGIGIFSVKFTAAGTFTITATDTVTGSINGVSGNIVANVPAQSVALTASGIWTVPSDWTSGKNSVECFGGGGGGTSRSSGGTVAGGGGGGWARKSNIALTPGSTVSVTVGAGGAGGSINGSDGGAGGATSFGGYCAANGGGGGVDYTPGAGGAGTVGDTGYSGGAGGPAGGNGSDGSGGGGAAGPSGAGGRGGSVQSTGGPSGGGGAGGGTAGQQASGITGGAGGNSVYAAGGAGGNYSVGSPGSNGSGGGGGSGGNGGGAGGNGPDYSGGGGGGAAGGYASSAGNGGAFGGGGGGSCNGGNGGAGGAGYQGVIVIRWGG